MNTYGKIFAILTVCMLMPLMIGCSSVKTCNYTESESLYAIASKENTDTDLLEKKALAVFVTESKSPVTFSLSQRSNRDGDATAKIDSSSYAAFFLNPGDYYFQRTSKISVKSGDIVYILCSGEKSNRLSVEEFKKKYDGLFLTEECSGTNSIVPAQHLVPDLVGGAKRFGYYTGKTIGNILASPFYVLWGSCFILANASKGAIDSGSPAYMVGGFLVYGLTFWAIPEGYNNLIEASDFSGRGSTLQTTSRSINTSELSSVVVNENAYGLGVHSDQYGRPVRYSVPNGVPGETLKVQQNAYGLGVHSDQYGRPVRTEPGF